MRTWDMAKMHPIAVDLVLVVRTGYVQDARTHACQWGLLDRIPHQIRSSTHFRVRFLQKLFKTRKLTVHKFSLF
jgi:hypothetical protein